MYLLYIYIIINILPWTPHTYDFVVLTSLTNRREILFVVLKIGKAKDLSAPLRTFSYTIDLDYVTMEKNSIVVQ
jgi:hypothetical protein